MERNKRIEPTEYRDDPRPAMNSTLKVIAPIVLVVLLVFGATLVSMYTGSTDTKELPADGSQPIVGPPLLFATTRMAYEPTSSDPAMKHFPGYYEPGETLVRVWFWFVNPYKVPVQFAVLKRSCSACTSARLAVMDSPAGSSYAVRAALGGGPIALVPSLTWKALDFEKPDESVEVPAAASDDEPTWGLFEMAIKVRGEGQNTLYAEAGLSVGTTPQSKMQFQVTIVGTPSFMLTPKSIDFGSLKEGTPPQTRTLYYWSATRDAAELPVPTIAVNAKDPYLEVGAAVPMTQEEREKLALSFIAEGKLARVLGGYKVPVTLHRQLPAAVPNFPLEPDIGPYDRQIGFTGPASATVAVTLAANIVGLVGLVDGTNIVFADFESRFGGEKTVNLGSDRSDLTLEPIAAEFRPRFLDVVLSEPTNEAGRRNWTLKVSVPKGQLGGEFPADSVVVFRAKTATGSYKIRIPVKGRAFDRVK